jgi:hypothetical protein
LIARFLLRHNMIDPETVSHASHAEAVPDVTRAARLRRISTAPWSRIGKHQIARAGTAADDTWDTEQMAKFVDHVATHRLGGCFGLMMPRSRREEVGGLRWAVIELETCTLHIRRGRVDVQGSDTIVPTKTERSARGRTLPRESAGVGKS